MAFAGAARAAFYARSRRNKLLHHTQSMNGSESQKSDRKKLVELLRQVESTKFISNIIDAEEAEVAKLAADQLETDDFVLPSDRLPYLSERHFMLLKKYSNDHGVKFDPSWLLAYIGSKADDAALPSELWKDKPEAEETNPEEGARPESSSLTKNFNEFVLLNQLIVASRVFTATVVSAVVLGGIIVGLATYPSLASSPVLSYLNYAIQCVFTLDIIFKLLQEGRRPWIYWTGENRAWNCFDVLITGVCWAPPKVIGVEVAFIRLIRLARLLKLAEGVKELRVLVIGLVHGLSSVVYVLILMFITYYMFAVLGTVSFQRNDPFLFGSVGFAMLTLFRIATSSRTNVLLLQYYGCKTQNWMVASNIPYIGGGANGTKYAQIGLRHPPYVSGLGQKNVFVETMFGSFRHRVCWHPRGHGSYAVAYFQVFIMIGGLVLTSLYIGAVCSGMQDALEEFEEEQEERRVKLAARLHCANDSNDVLLESMRDLFDAIDGNGSGDISAAELTSALKPMGDSKATEEQAQKWISKYDRNGDATLDFREYVLVLSKGDIDIDKDATEKKKRQAELDGPIVTAHKQALTSAREATVSEKRTEITQALRSAWDYPNNSGHVGGGFALIVKHAKRLSQAYIFKTVMAATICIAGVLVGVTVDRSPPGSPDKSPVLLSIDNAILAIFTFEIVVKMTAMGHRPWRYFNDAWNRFDFIIVSVCFVFKTPVLASRGNVIAMLRLFRLLRLLKLINNMPTLQRIVDGLLRGFSSLRYVLLIGFFVWYIFAIVGNLLFARNDPSNFYSLHNTLITLVRVATYDSWSDVLYQNMLGCDVWTTYKYGRREYHYQSKAFQKRAHSNCNHPVAWGWIAPAYFVTFCIVGGQVFLSLVIGTIVSGMGDVKGEISDLKELADRLGLRLARLKIPHSDPTLLFYREAFAIISDGRAQIFREEVKDILIPSIFSITSCEEKIGAELDASPARITRPDIDKIFEVLSLWDADHFDGNAIEFPEFVVLLDFVRRSISQPGLLDSLRFALSFQKRKSRMLMKADSASAQMFAAFRRSSGGSASFDTGPKDEPAADRRNRGVSLDRSPDARIGASLDSAISRSLSEPLDDSLPSSSSGPHGSTMSRDPSGPLDSFLDRPPNEPIDTSLDSAISRSSSGSIGSTLGRLSSGPIGISLDSVIGISPSGFLSRPPSYPLSSSLGRLSSRPIGTSLDSVVSRSPSRPIDRSLDSSDSRSFSSSLGRAPDRWPVIRLDRVGRFSCAYANASDASTANGIDPAEMSSLLDSGQIHGARHYFIRTKPGVAMTGDETALKLIKSKIDAALEVAMRRSSKVKSVE